MTISAKTEGFAGLEDALIELEQFSGKTTLGKNAVMRGLKKAMKRVEDRAKQLVPVDDGHLRDSITTKKERAKRVRGSAKFKRETGISMLTGPAPKGTLARSNAAWQEEGTVEMRPQPYMRPAADSEGEKVVDEVADVLREEVLKTAARAKKRAARKAR